MNRRTVLVGLVLTVLLQLGVLAGEYLGAVYPLWSGQEVRLKVVPIDPRSLFRGNYARLNYAISTVTLDVRADRGVLPENPLVYVRLKQGDDGVFVADGASLQRPDAGLYLRGRLKGGRYQLSYGMNSPVQVRYGIEAWFAPKDKALQLEHDLRGGAVAVVMVASNGKAALKAIEPTAE
ncbi:hypothetical protein BOW53_14385 [Solemya pervernicosa gill symbiont]|uniref:GDYXXLXY domain-containing protein n=2 Tax=Gammaproteobacteria incertae sedis TaxID=118884 RepID=A0A1T2L0T5_9GAMM|nr:GDYXXLXY domain-containing protein [Candidatus Reidiella endopervernicosa]OOZ38709.1 hypothetical protein BOW53_14385 [Solemya pervernicosa gill symbiont]QKQ25819.1 GDYXXLXY domain-containing protein [Candidatus Reidiella endopervernicosa]